MIFLEKIKRSILLGGLVTSVIGVLIGIWFSRRITTPVTALTNAARNLSRGNRPTQLPVTSNALRHTDPGGEIVVSLGLERMVCEEEEVDCVVTRIRDTGSGIPAQDLPHIFERFYRVDAARSREQGGRGLGLAIVRRIIEGHGGLVWAESRLGQGATIAYALPCLDKNWGSAR